MTQYYKFILNEDTYIIGCYVVGKDQEYDYYGDIDSVVDLFEGWYKCENKTLVLDEDKKAEIIAEREAEKRKPTWQETIEAQVTYTAMMTDTLIEGE